MTEQQRDVIERAYDYSHACKKGRTDTDTVWRILFDLVHATELAAGASKRKGFSRPFNY